MGREEENLALFETKGAKGTGVYRLFSGSIFVGICLIWAYRLSHIDTESYGIWAWLCLVAAELWFSFYWVITQSLRWKPVHRHTFKDRLAQRFTREQLPGVDVFVCTADASIEPPTMVVNTVLSAMAYDYPPEKLAVYLSDDGGSELTYYALLEAAAFARHWVPYCKEFHVEPRSPSAYFSSLALPAVRHAHQANRFVTIKRLYKEMEERIEKATKFGEVNEEEKSKHRGFSQWNSYMSRRDHDTILQILIDGEDAKSIDTDGCALPTLVYMAREKRPNHPHNFKAGAMNALIRVSSKISNGEIILNVDCDMYSNNSESIRDALCFLMDKENGREIAFVQFPQVFDNSTKNDLYGSDLRVIREVEFHGMDGYGGTLYVGSGCFHRRAILCGRKYDPELNIVEEKKEIRERETTHELEEISRSLASCTVEQNTQWGKEMGLKYGCPVEDVITGLSIQTWGWKSAYFNPARHAFLGVAPTTLPQTLVQHKR